MRKIRAREATTLKKIQQHPSNSPLTITLDWSEQSQRWLACRQSWSVHQISRSILRSHTQCSLMPTVSTVYVIFIGAVRHRINSIHTLKYYHFPWYRIIHTCTVTRMCWLSFPLIVTASLLSRPFLTLLFSNYPPCGPPFSTRDTCMHIPTKWDHI